MIQLQHSNLWTWLRLLRLYRDGQLQVSPNKRLLLKTHCSMQEIGQLCRCNKTEDLLPHSVCKNLPFYFSMSIITCTFISLTGQYLYIKGHERKKKNHHDQAYLYASSRHLGSWISPIVFQESPNYFLRTSPHPPLLSWTFPCCFPTIPTQLCRTAPPWNSWLSRKTPTLLSRISLSFAGIPLPL